MTRQRQVFPRDTVAHMWTHGAQDSARDPSGNFYFTGPALFSYGSHFVIGYRIAGDDAHRTVYVMNASTYGNTTSKHQSHARLALPGYMETLWLSGLNSETFSGPTWPARLMREALSQAGRMFADAGKVSRVSMKRYRIVVGAVERMRAARVLAERFAENDNAENRKAARATLATVERATNDVPEAKCADNARERAACNALAVYLVRDELRAEMLEKVKRAHTCAGYAADVTFRISARYSHLTEAIAAGVNARNIAKSAGFRLPKLPDLAPIAAVVEPLHKAARIKALQTSVRDSLEFAERCKHYGKRDGSAWHSSSVLSYVNNAASELRQLRELGTDAPAWMRERLDRLRAWANRRGALSSISGWVISAASMLDQAESYRDAGRARDAVHSYRAVLNALDKLDAARLQMPNHPSVRDAAPLQARREEAERYIAESDALILAENAAKVDAWRNGGRAEFRAWDLPILLRLVGDRIETSRGAVVPASVAPRLWTLVRAAMAGDAAAITERVRGMRVGHFDLNEIRADGSIVVGCHDIPGAELQAMAVHMGLPS